MLYPFDQYENERYVRKLFLLIIISLFSIIVIKGREYLKKKMNEVRYVYSRPKN